MKYKAKTTVDRNEEVTLKLYLLGKYSIHEALVYQTILDNGGILESSAKELSDKVKISKNVYVSRAISFLRDSGILKVEDLGSYRRRYTLLDIENPIDKSKLTPLDIHKGKIKERFDKLPDSVRERVLAIQELRKKKFDKNFADTK